MSEKTLVVIDDDDLVGQLVVEAARQVGFEAQAVQDFEAFRTRVEADEPDLMLLDLVLPNVDGIQVLRFLADRECQSKIWLLSGFDPKVVQTAERLGLSLGLNIVGTMTKPVSVATLKSELRQHLDESGQFTRGDLVQAIEANRLFVHFQPKVALQKGYPGASEGHGLAIEGQSYPLVGCEALARWQNASGLLIPPNEFISVAEEASLIDDLTVSVFHQVIETLSHWNGRGVRLNVSVNVSPTLLSDLDLPDRLAGRAQSSQVDPGQIVLEITENASVSDDPHFMDVLSRFRLKGFGLSLDDFGTGYSSLIQIYRMPFTEMKIDGSFVSEMIVNDEAMTIVQSIINLGHNLGMSVCAEGVESVDIAQALQDMGCDAAQGYFFGRPDQMENIMERVGVHQQPDTPGATLSA